jgi:Flp pilus assembly CpaE family ATPase
MLRTLIISPDSDLCQRLRKALDETGCVTSVRVVDHYPDEVQFSRILRAHGPQVVFLGIDSLDYCTAAATHIEAVMPGLQVVAVGRQCDANVLMAVMRTGVREFLGMPFEPSTVDACIGRITANLRARPLSLAVTDAVFTFLPSKPGSGASTLATNVSLAMAATGTQTLLADFDLNSGMLRFMLNAGSEYSIMDALQNAAAMDEERWAQIVNRRENLHVLHAGRINPELRIEKIQVQHLLEYARRNYGAFCADLSGNLEKYSIELMHESKKIFLVCTPEITSLHLAREKMQYLDHLDLADRTAVLLNRQNRRAVIATSEVESLVGAPVHTTFPNDYSTVSRAIAEGAPVAKNSEFGKQCSALANAMLSKKIEPVSEKRKFVEYFAITPARFSFAAKKP